MKNIYRVIRENIFDGDGGYIEIEADGFMVEGEYVIFVKIVDNGIERIHAILAPDDVEKIDELTQEFEPVEEAEEEDAEE